MSNPGLSGSEMSIFRHGGEANDRLVRRDLTRATCPDGGQQMKAVVFRGEGKYGVEEVTLDPPKAGEVRIKMGATGVCHSDLSVINGVLPLPP